MDLSQSKITSYSVCFHQDIYVKSLTEHRVIKVMFLTAEFKYNNVITE